jgi:RNA polymerase sigma-70 factor, ECF subfamily
MLLSGPVRQNSAGSQRIPVRILRLLILIRAERVRWMLFGDQERLFEGWIQEHKGVILKVVRANAANAEDQNDLFQEIAFQVWRSIPSFRGEAKVSTWMYRVALNTAMIWRRSEKKHRHLHDSLYVVNEPSDSNEIPSESLENREKLEWLYEEVRKLPTIERSLVLLYLDARSYEEIAEILGIAITHVGVKLNRLKKYLGDAYRRGDR